MLGRELDICEHEPRRQAGIRAAGIGLEKLPGTVSHLNAGTAAAAHGRLEDRTCHQIATGRNPGLYLVIRQLIADALGIRRCKSRLDRSLAGSSTAGGLTLRALALGCLSLPLGRLDLSLSRLRTLRRPCAVGLALLECLHPPFVGSIQLGALSVPDDVALAALLNTDPERRGHSVQVPANAPLHCGSLHRVG